MNVTKADQKDRKLDVGSIQKLLIDRICMLHYMPGDQLKESDLAAEFGVSRTPIRDALNRISHLGMIESRNGVGTVVVELGKEQIRQIYELRLELALLIGKLSPIRPDEEHLAIFEGLLARSEILKKDFVFEEYISINHTMIDAIASLIGNDSLRLMWLHTYFQAASTWYRVANVIPEEVTQALVEELLDLIDAARHRDSEAMGYIQRIHINYGFYRIKATLWDKKDG